MSDRYENLRTERRFVFVPIDATLIGNLLLGGRYRLDVEGLPSDAIFVTAERDLYSQDFSFVYLHESFEPVPEGQNGPRLYATLRTQEDKK